MDRSLTARLVSAGLLPLAALSAHATDATLTADTHVNSARPTTNYGYLSNISVGSGTTSLFQFDLSTLPTGTTASQISKATLHLFINRVYTPGTVDVLPVTSPWTDPGIATLTATPALGTQALSAIYVPATSPVQDWTPSTSNTINEAVTPVPDFSLTSTSDTQTAYPAASAAFTINVLPNPAPFTGTVTFSVSGLPAGATATFSPTSVTPGSSAVATTMTVKVPAATVMLRFGTGVGGSVAFRGTPASDREPQAPQRGPQADCNTAAVHDCCQRRGGDVRLRRRGWLPRAKAADVYAHRHRHKHQHRERTACSRDDSNSGRRVTNASADTAGPDERGGTLSFRTGFRASFRTSSRASFRTSSRTGILLATFAIASCAGAQDFAAARHRMDVSVTYTAEHANPVGGCNSWLPGGSAEFGTDLWHGIGVAANLTGVHTNSFNFSGLPLSLVSVTFGPR